MLRQRGRIELLLFFFLGIAVFAFYETVASFQALNCSHHEHPQRNASPKNPNPPSHAQGKDYGKQHGDHAVSEPFVCSVVGFPTAQRVFMNQNEGFAVGGFTFLLVFVTGWLVRATIRLWQGAEDTAQRQLRAYISVRTGDGFRQGAARGLRFEFRPVFVNSGQTPAYFVNSTAAMRFLRFEDAGTYDFAGNLPPLDQVGVLTLGSQQDRFSSVVLDRVLSKAELRQFRRGTHALFVFGTVFYRDAFQDPPTHKLLLCDRVVEQARPTHYVAHSAASQRQQLALRSLA